MFKYQQTCRREESCTHLWHAGHSTNQEHLPNVTLGHFGILHGLLAGGHCAADEISYNALKLRAGELHVQMLGARCIHGQVRQVNISLMGEMTGLVCVSFYFVKQYSANTF